MKRTLLVAAVAALCAVVPTTAQAVTVKPDHAPLVDSARVDSGCTVQVHGGAAPGPTQGPFVGATGYLKVVTDLSCGHRWRAHAITVGWQPVVGGRRGAIFQGAAGKGWMTNAQVPSPDPMSVSTFTTINPCLARNDGFTYDPGESRLPWMLRTGLNEVIYRGTAKVNEYKSDLHPYQATVEKLVTVRCTSARAAFR